MLLFAANSSLPLDRGGDFEKQNLMQLSGQRPADVS